MHKRRTGRGYLLAIGILFSASLMPAFCQTKAPADDSPTASTGSEDAVSVLKQQIAAQQKQIEQLQTAMAEMKKRIDRADQGTSSTLAVSPDLLPNVGQVASLTPVVPKAAVSATPSAPMLPAAPAAFYNNGASSADEQGLSPLSVKIGGVEFTPGGFLDFTTYGRSTNLGSGIGSAFGSAPYSNTPTGQLSESRFTMQNSRLSMDVTGKYVGFDWHGHIEADFLGFGVPNLYTTSNSNTLRSRLYWIDGRKGKFEFLGGQSWTMMTPNRTGLSPNPSDIFYSQDMDTNYQLGLTWARQAQLRLIYHPTETIAAGISIEDGDQYYQNATIPSALAFEGDNGSGAVNNANVANNPAAPSVAPDVVGKIAFDPMVGKLHEHIEFAGVLTSTRVYDPSVGVKSSAEGAGGSVNVNLELVKNFHFIVNTFYSDGAGRYIFGLAPNFIIDRDGNGNYHPSLVHSSSGIAGFEYQVVPNTMLYGYYGGVHIQRNFGIDCFLQPIPSGSPSGTLPTCTSTPTSSPSYIGYGYPGSSNSQNRNLQEPTFGVIQTFWKNPHYGALSLITQYSYLTRNPWFLKTGAPKNAHLSMGYVDLRYTLP